MPYIIPETDRVAELRTLQDELLDAKSKYNSDNPVTIRNILQIQCDIERNQEQLRAIL